MPEAPARHSRPLWRDAILTVPAVLLLGIASGRLSNSGYGNPWFDALAKPAVMPPGWAFGAAWTILYILLGLVLAMLLNARGVPGRKAALALFGAQLALNFAWSAVFFGLHAPAAAFALILAILVLAAAATFVIARVRPAAAWLMLPYLLSLGFAAALNQAIVLLNR